MKQIISISLVLILIAAGVLLYSAGPRPANAPALPIFWKNYAKQLQELGVIDRQKFNSSLPGGPVVMTRENSHALLNLLWAVGLANKNPILENGPMMDPRYNGAGNFASTGGWSLAVGDPMSHYSMHALVTLSAEQQALVESISKNIYRPCCDNSTYFPDCNHGMAMLGLLEIMAAQGMSEADMYKTARAVNGYWFPEQYKVIAEYLAKQKIPIAAMDPKEILRAKYSSASGYAKIVAALAPQQGSGGGSCGV